MRIDKAILHAREVAEKERKSKCNTYDINDCYKCEKYKEISTSKRMTEIICPCGNKTFEYIPSENKNVRVDKNDCLQCAEEQEQIAEWLEELKFLRQWKADVMEDFCKYDASSIEEVYRHGVASVINEQVEEIQHTIERCMYEIKSCENTEKCLEKLEELRRCANG